MSVTYLRWAYRALLAMLVIGAPAVILAGLIAIPFGPRMREQPRLKPYEQSEFFDDHRSVRRPPPGTIAQGQRALDAPFYWGRTALPPVPSASEPATSLVPLSAQADGKPPTANVYVDQIPMPLTGELLRRGRERFNIYCAPCHGRSGDGQGVITFHGFPTPPSFHTPKLREAPAGYLFDVITQGYGMMFSYASRIKPADRWATVAYIRALQLSQRAPARMLSPGDLQKLREATR
jgi:hypothetical protein